MKIKYLFLTVCLSISCYNLIGQGFVHPGNRWLVDDCFDMFDGSTNCTTYEYWFDGIVFIDSEAYLELKTDSPGTFFLGDSFGKYYREDDGLIYMKKDEIQDEKLIYNFNWIVGETIQLTSSNTFTIGISSIDTITLNSGEKRKRLKIVNNLYWIEGIGSMLAPMNTAYMFSVDAWLELTCFYRDDNLLYGLGECETTSLKNINQIEKTISCYPNPTTEQIIITSSEKEKIKQIEIIGIYGNSILQVYSHFSQPINLNGIQEGMYFVKVVFKDGSIGLTKVLKTKN